MALHHIQILLLLGMESFHYVKVGYEILQGSSQNTKEGGSLVSAQSMQVHASLSNHLLIIDI